MTSVQADGGHHGPPEGGRHDDGPPEGGRYDDGPPEGRRYDDVESGFSRTPSGGFAQSGRLRGLRIASR